MNEDEAQAVPLSEVERDARARLADELEEWAMRWVLSHPVAICQDFTPKGGAAAFWCAHCGWNQLRHEDEASRAAVAAVLARLNEADTR